jgi:hypothetical protein
MSKKYEVDPEVAIRHYIKKREYIDRWKRENKDLVNIYTDRWRAANPEAYKDSQARSALKQKEKRDKRREEQLRQKRAVVDDEFIEALRVSAPVAVNMVNSTLIDTSSPTSASLDQLG